MNTPQRNTTASRRSWLSRLARVLGLGALGSDRLKTHAAGVRARVTPRLEPLEDRLVPAGSIKTVGTTVIIMGTTNDDAAVVANVNGKVTVVVGDTESQPVHQEFAADDVAKVLFIGSEGNDVFLNLTSLQCGVSGGSGHDLLVGGEGSDTIRGGLGNDVILDRGGDDEIHGEDGDDLIDAGAGNDFVYGGNGHDVIHGNLGSDKLFGEDGFDRLYGEDGVDIILGGYGMDMIDGGAKTDLLMGDQGRDFLYGNDGMDLLVGGDSDDILDGGASLDFLIGLAGDDTLIDDEFGGIRLDIHGVNEDVFGHVFTVSQADEVMARLQVAMILATIKPYVPALQPNPAVVGFQAMPVDRILSDIQQSTAPANLQTGALGAAATAVSFASVLPQTMMYDVLHNYQLGGIPDPNRTVYWNTNSLFQAQPYIAAKPNGMWGNFYQGLQFSFPGSGGNPFSSDANILNGTGLLDDGLIKTIFDGSGGFSYHPSPNDPYYQMPIYQQFYGSQGGSLLNFISGIISKDLQVIM